MKYKQIIKDTLFLFLLVLLDQVTKQLAVRYLSDGREIPLIPNVFVLHLLPGGNSGAAFGLFQGKFWFFLIMTILILAIVFYVLWKIRGNRKFTFLHYILLLLTAGALGNFIDRVYTFFTEGYNYVIDFLYFKWIDFPIFNVADCYVTISVILLIIAFLFCYKEEDLDQIISLKKEKKKEWKR